MRKLLLFSLFLLMATIAGADTGVLLRDDCATISSPVAGQTFCFDRTANDLKKWNGSAWVIVSNTQPTAGAELSLTKQLTDNVVFNDKFATTDICATTSGAIDQIGATVTTLILNASATCGTTKTVPSTLTLQFLGAGQLSLNAGVTLTLNGPLVAPPRQIFAGSGTVAFGSTFSGTLNPLWWGNNTTPGTTDMTAALKAAIAASQNGLRPHHVHIPVGQYVVTDTLLPDDPRTVWITGEGPRTELINRIARDSIGTVTTNQTTTVTGTGFTNTLRYAQLEIDGYLVRVASVTNSTTLVLTEAHPTSFTGTGYRHKALFFFNDQSVSQNRHNASRLADFWINGPQQGSYTLADRSDAIVAGGTTMLELDRLILTPFGSGIVQVGTSIFVWAHRINIWPAGGFVDVMPGTAMSELDAVVLESGGAKDASIYDRVYINGGRYGFLARGTGVSSGLHLRDVTVQIGSPAESGTATSVGASTITDTAKAWTVNAWRDFLVVIKTGTGLGQVRRITSNTATQLTVTPPWDTADTPVATDTFEIGAGGIVAFNASASWVIDNPYFESNAYSNDITFFGGASNHVILGSGNGVARLTFSVDPAGSEAFANTIIGGRWNGIRLDSKTLRNRFLGCSVQAQGANDTWLINRGALNSFDGCFSPSELNRVGTDQIGVLPLAPHAELRGLLDNGTTEEVIAKFSGTYNVGTFKGGSTGIVANNGTITLGGVTALIGFLVVQSATEDKAASFFVVPSGVTEVTDPDGMFSSTQGTASSTNVYLSAGNLIVENKRGGNQNYVIQLLGGTGF